MRQINQNNKSYKLRRIREPSVKTSSFIVIFHLFRKEATPSSDITTTYPFKPQSSSTISNTAFNNEMLNVFELSRLLSHKFKARICHLLFISRPLSSISLIFSVSSSLSTSSCLNFFVPNPTHKPFLNGPS